MLRNDPLICFTREQLNNDSEATGTRIPKGKYPKNSTDSVF